MTKILIITGPTATGKTKLGIELAKQFNGEIISADSRQVYQGNDIETGKDRSFPQRGIDLVEPGEEFSASHFVKYAKEKIQEISARGHLPIIVGGTGLYIKELLNPSETLHIPPNPDLRKRLSNCSIAQLQEELEKIDKNKWEQMNQSDRQNPRRLIRAIEIQKSKIKNQKFNSKIKIYDSLIIGLNAPPEVIYQKIVARRQDRPDLVNKEFTLAKKQLVYMKKYLNPIWFDITDPNTHNKIKWQVKMFLNLANT